MARQLDNASWPYVEELLEGGDPRFVAEIRRITDADLLGSFAARWHADRRPASRRLLYEYFDQPLNAYRHEALVKRLFKFAEKAEDDELMASFLVAFDRSVRRIRRKRRHRQSQIVADRSTAESVIELWRGRGVENATYYQFRDQFHLFGWHVEEALSIPDGSTMPRGRWYQYRNPRTGERIRLQDVMRLFGRGADVSPGPNPISDEAREQLKERRLFTPATRRYLQRRAWRYFRKLGKQHPDRYIAAVSIALKGYRDEDVADG